MVSVLASVLHFSKGGEEFFRLLCAQEQLRPVVHCELDALGTLHVNGFVTSQVAVYAISFPEIFPDLEVLYVLPLDPSPSRDQRRVAIRYATPVDNNFQC